MKRFTTLCAGLGAMTFLGLGATGAMLSAGCEDRNTATQVRTVAAETEWIQGMIESVNLEENEFTMVVQERRDDDEDKKVTIRINEETQYFLDDNPASREDALQKDHRASVLHEDTLAISVYAYSADPE